MGGKSGITSIEGQSKWPTKVLPEDSQILLVFGPHVRVETSAQVVSSSGKDYLALLRGTNEDATFEGLPMQYLNQLRNENDR
jgi:hypothetical protein